MNLKQLLEAVTRVRATVGVWYCAARAWLRRWEQRISSALTPEEATQRWLYRAGLAALIGFGLWLGSHLMLGFGILIDMLAGAVIVLLFTGLASLALTFLFGLLNRLYRHLGAAAAAVLLTAVGLLGMQGATVGLAIALSVVGGAMLVIAGVMGLWPARRYPIRGGLATVLGVALVVGALLWLAGDGDDEDPVAPLVTVFEGDGGAYVELLETGPHEVASFTYGSGQDRHRPEYADGVRFVTESVDGTRMLSGWSGWRGNLRERMWGFGRDALPINARVWHPADLEDRDTARPLVLVVHGNANMMAESDRGYAWLGEHLASRGFVVASVDQNFLNGGFMVGGTHPENDARGWLLLEHLRQWREWNDDEEHPLHGRVDLERVLLIGHSRGGEAVYLAGVFNALPYYPDDARVAFDYDFGIRGVLAIAPVDGQFRPSGKRPSLENTSFFTIQGGYDADVAFFDGDRQYGRAKPDPEAAQFKSALYVHHANHGQFNTQWGRRDAWGMPGRVLNVRRLLSGEDQRRVGLLYFTAFAERAINDNGLDPLFCQPREAGELLPASLYVARCDDGRRQVIADFDEGLDLTRSGDGRLQLSGEGLALWKEAAIPLRRGTRERTGLWLGWRENGETPASYRLRWDDALVDELGLNADSVFWMELAQADQAPPEDEAAEDENGNDENGNEEDVAEDDTASEDENDNALRDPLAFSIVLTDADGHSVSRPLADFQDLLPPMPVRFLRVKHLENRFYRSPTEPQLQSVRVPVRAFDDGEIDLDRLRALQLVFDQGGEGVLIVDEIAVQAGGNDD
jgi:hypothetical protein